MSTTESLRILDFTDDRGLLAGRLLADLGGDVVCLEPCDSHKPPQVPLTVNDQRSFYKEIFGANRLHVDLSCSDDDSIDQLIGVADAIILTGGPAELRKDGWDLDSLQREYPHLIIAVISPFGLVGDLANQVATDLTLWAAGGVLEPHRSQTGVPLRPSAPQTFLHAGADAAIGILLAVFARQSTGRGQVVDVSAQSSLSTTTLGRVLAHALGDPSVLRPRASLNSLDRSGSGSATSGDFKKWEALDGLVEFHLAMGPASGRFTNSFIQWMIDEGQYPSTLRHWDWVRIPELMEQGEFTDKDLDDIRAVTQLFIASKTRDEVREAALERKLLCVGISHIEDLAHDPHFQERDIFHSLGNTGLTIVDKWVHILGGVEPAIYHPPESPHLTVTSLLRRWKPSE